ncbi:hypothetical protein [Neobacillus sp. NPDC093127]|uniref:hypothetical protein n=1 Tax=Neobacillus sp. NPDC093127 TaxID=3364296 RepID=UPI003828019A
MEQDKVNGSLNEVNSLDNSEKQIYKEMCFVITKDISTKKGKAHKTVIQIDKSDGSEMQLISINKKIKKIYPTAHDKLKCINLKDEVTKEFENEINEGNINSNHVTDIQKITLSEELNRLNKEDQKQVINNIIKNRNERNLINSEQVATFALLNGEINTQIIEIWYRGINRTVDQFIGQLESGLSIINKLPKQQSDFLLEKFNKTQKLIQQYFNEKPEDQ